MSRKYKFLNKEGVYFVSFSVVFWLKVFDYKEYCQIIIDNLNYCIQNKGLELYSWCIMPNHIHLIFSANNADPDKLLGKFKEVTSKKIVDAIIQNKIDTNHDTFLYFFKKAAKKKSNVNFYQFWQHHNKPIELWSSYIIDIKINYIHQNPVKAGLVLNADDWIYSSARNYNEDSGLIKIKTI